ncbi:hypothetical protein [Pseudoalteromonas atlantica]|uniref:hypothetical protein n=1 Tax=Pseudoalteromonas atlantica TaxID=288 RepID=UPI003736C053
MKFLSVLTVFLLLAGCASQEVKDGYENGVYAEHECLGGEVETDYNYTIFSSDEDEINKSTVQSTCQPVKTETEFERDLRTGG